MDDSKIGANDTSLKLGGKDPKNARQSLRINTRSRSQSPKQSNSSPSSSPNPLSNSPPISIPNSPPNPMKQLSKKVMKLDKRFSSPTSPPSNGSQGLDNENRPRRVSFQILKKYEEKLSTSIQPSKKLYGSDITHKLVSPHQIKLLWEESPRHCFISYNPFNSDIVNFVFKVTDFLHKEKGCSIVVEPKCFEEFHEKYPYLQTWNEEQDKVNTLNGVDLAVCLGGDGTVLHCVRQFSESCPPVLGFGMGSIGFLTLFDVNSYQLILSRVLEKSIHISTRSRLTCRIHRFDTDVVDVHQVLNEVVCDRGASPYLTSLDTFCNDKLITNVQADGLIVATPNGSSAYSMSAGGSIVHPSVPCILLTPICPHSLSFRPIILPDSAILRIQVPETARASAFVSFDGTYRQELRKGDSVSIETSRWPIPLIVTNDATSAWFRDLGESFGWSRRKQQRPFS